MISVTTNVAALVAKRNLSENSLQATRSIAKVSQGTRVVKPMDDAASLAISNTMRTSLAGMTQGIRNTTQGSSLLQVAAGGLEQTSQMLTRMKQLAVQVINDTLGSAEISYANEEFGQLMQQIDSTAEQTRFSGKSLLTGGSVDAMYKNTGRSSNFPNIAQTPAFTGEIDNAVSSGFIHHKFPSDIKDMDVEAIGNEVRVNFGGEYFRAPTAVESNGQLVLTSESDEKNVVSLNLNADISTIQTNSSLVIELKQLLLNAEINVGETKEMTDSGAIPLNNTFSVTNFLDTDRTHGAISASIRQPNDVTVVGDPGNYTVEIIVGDEAFRQTNVSPVADGVLELVSVTNPGNQIAIRYNETSVAGLNTTANFQTALRTTLIDRRPAVGTFNNPPANDFISPDFTDINTQNDFHGDFTGVVTDLHVETRDGGLHAELAIEGKFFTTPEIPAEINTGDVITFVGASNSNNRFSITYNGAGITAANFATPADREAEYESQLEAFFTRIQFFVSGANFYVGDRETVFNDYSLSVDVSDQQGNGFAGFNTLYSKGFIHGSAQSVEVTGSDSGPFDISLVVGDQTFVQRGFNPDFESNLTLVSQSDPENVISYTVGEGLARTYLDTLPELKTSLESLFGLSKLDSNAPAQFQSASAANNGYNGINMGNNQTILAGIATKPGTYALSYDGDTNIIKLTNGITVHKEKIDEKLVIDGKTTVSFSNGVTLRLGDDNNRFDINTSISQMTFEVDQNDAVQLEFQVSDLSKDDMKINMTAATVEALRLTGSNISDKDLARDAQDKIDLAITSINTGLANIGAQQSRFEFVRVNLTIQMENTTASRATYYDVDMGGEITDFTKYQTLTQAATSMLSQANKMPQELMRLLP